MDKALFHTLWTILLFVCFIGVVWWAFNKHSKKGFDEAALLIFADEKDKQADNQGEDK